MKELLDRRFFFCMAGKIQYAILPEIITDRQTQTIFPPKFSENGTIVMSFSV